MRTFKMIFGDVDKLNEMLSLRRQGWTYTSLGIIYGVDHSSIYKWCKIYKIPVPRTPIAFNLEDLIASTGFTNEQKKEKNYADYIEEARRKKYPKLYQYA